MDSGIRLAIMSVIGLVLMLIGITGKLGSVFGAIIDPASMTGGGSSSGGAGSPLPTTGTLTMEQIGEYWYRVASGTSTNAAAFGNVMTTAIAVAWAESAGVINAVNRNNPDGS